MNNTGRCFDKKQEKLHFIAHIHKSVVFDKNAGQYNSVCKDAFYTSPEIMCPHVCVRVKG